jgi:hypothetical protein
MKPPFTLMPDRISHDSVEALETLLSEAKRGDLIGLTFTAMYRKRNYVVNAAGEAHRNPTFALGMVEVLNDYLMQQVNRGEMQ